VTNKDLILMKKAYSKTLRENTSGGNQIYGLFFDNQEGAYTLLGVYSDQQTANQAEEKYKQEVGEDSMSSLYVSVIPLNMNQHPSHDFVKP